MADITADLKNWSATASSNLPSGSTTVGTGVDDNLRQIQAVVKQDLAHVGANIASGSTTDLGAIAGLFHTITGTTTITSFGTVSAGIWKILTFSGALTITHNGTSLICPNGVNIITAANDSVLAESLGSGNWKIHTLHLSALPLTKIELGHESDTTLSRVSAGVVAVEGVTLLTTNTGALKGANSDITSLSALSTPLSVVQGGMSLSTLTANNVILGNGTSAPQFVAPGANGNQLTSDGTTWLSSPPFSHTTLTYSLTSDVNLTSTSTYFDGPYVAQGTSGTWLVVGSVNLRNTAASSNYSVKLWDGTTVIASAHVYTAAANVSENVTLTGIITSPAGNLRISVKDNNYTTNTAIRFNQSGNSQDSVISAVRII